MTNKDKYDLFAELDNHLCRARFEPIVRHDTLYPSEASVKFYDSHGDLTVKGGCLRATYFRIVGEYEKIPHSAYTQWIFQMGKLAEGMIINVAKEAGLWVDNNIKFYNKEFNVSGEIDVILKEPDGTMYPAEIKTCYGYFAEKEIFGNMHQKGFPKLSQLLQLLVYLHEFRDQFPYGRMVYFFRDSVKRRTFHVALQQEGDIIYPVVDGEVIRAFTVNDILARYKEVQSFIDKRIVPPADYELQYSEAKIADFFKKKKISKSKFEKWQKGQIKNLGDWKCNGYCSYCKLCYADATFATDDTTE